MDEFEPGYAEAVAAWDAMTLKRTNDQRSSDALDAITDYHVSVNGLSSTLDPEEGMTDLVTDMRHLADDLQISWEQLLARVEMHHDAETE